MKTAFRTRAGIVFALLPFAGSPLLTGCTMPQGGLQNPFSTNAYGIPDSKMPPPGLCRVWYPNRRAEWQPPIGDCDYLAARLPSGAQLIRGDGGGGGGVAGAYNSPSQVQPSSVVSSYPAGPDPTLGAPAGAPPQTLPPGGEDMRSRHLDDLNRRY